MNALDKVASVLRHCVSRTSDTVQFIADQFREIKTPDDCSTPEELRNYAYGIIDRNPSLAQDLIAAANRADDDTV